MTNKEIEMFREEIKKYRYLQMTSKMIADKIDICLYEMTGVKGVTFDKVRGGYNEYLISLKRSELSDHYEKLTKQYNNKQARLKAVDEVLDRMNEDDRELFKIKYIDGKSYDYIAKKLYISKTGLIYRMNKVLKEL